MPHNNRLIPIPGVKNFRDMGGYRTKSGMLVRTGRLYRSGHLSDMAVGGGNILHERKINTVIDFRSDREKERHPVRPAAPWTPQYHPTPIGGNAAAWVRDLYDRLATSPFPAQELRDQFILAFETIPIANTGGLKQFFRVLASEDDGAVLFHCTAGKDRTGIAGALLMYALGAHDDDIMADFLLTNDAVDLPATSTQTANHLSKRAGRKIAASDVHPLVGVEPAFLEAAYRAIRKEYGDLETYLTETLGLTTKNRDALARRFLED